MTRTPDIKRILETMSYVLRGGTVSCGQQNWTLGWPYGWWSAWKGCASQVRDKDVNRWVTTFADSITFTVLSYSQPCPEIAKIAQNVEDVPMDIIKILGNMSALLRGRRLSVNVDGDTRSYFYDGANSTLRYEMPAVLMRPGLPAESTTYVCAAPNMAFSELITILTTGETNAG